jgi:acyl-CoA thioester hydrolase
LTRIRPTGGRRIRFVTETFERVFHVRWGDMDFNAHMKNTAYLDMSGDVRMMYFVEQGFSMREFERLKMGPVVMRDELEYFREMRLLESIKVNLLVAGLSNDASRFIFRNEFFREDGKIVSRVTSTGGWLGHVERRLVAPPDQLANVILKLKRSDDFRELEPRSRKA